MMQLILKIFLSILIILIAGLALHRVWTHKIDPIKWLKSFSKVIPTEDEINVSPSVISFVPSEWQRKQIIRIHNYKAEFLYGVWLKISMKDSRIIYDEF